MTVCEQNQPLSTITSSPKEPPFTTRSSALRSPSAKMSYAAAAAKGPKQSPEEARAAPVPEIENSETASTASLIDVDTDSVHTVPSNFSSQNIQTSTQADRIEQEADAEEARARDLYAKEKEKAAKSAKDAKAKGKRAANRLEANSDNPVFVGNAVAVVALSAGLGFGAYRKYAAGELTWKVAGAWAGVVGLFAAGDFYLSQYLLKNKYPARK